MNRQNAGLATSKRLFTIARKTPRMPPDFLSMSTDYLSIAYMHTSAIWGIIGILPTGGINNLFS
jgi:hypothetical protein